ncbi:tetratricopeptide repeat protein [Streptomyces sp. NPDC059037]|uniref:tetratricopeptide repeat protein n=1 Tax=Streptomyces sp. NPDC059037 TaxID=3346710 RepID=UPI00369B2F75
MEPELEELAASAAEALMAASRTDKWAEVSARVAHHLGDAGLSEGWLSARGPDPAAVRARKWQGRLARLLVSNPSSVTELRSIVAEFAPLADGGPQVRNTVSGGVTDGTVIQSGRIDSLTVNAAPGTAQDHIDFRDGTFNGPAIGVQHNHYGAPSPTARATAADWPPIGRLRRLDLGVHPTRRLDGESSVPPYVMRDCDGELNRLVKSALRGGGLVVVTGEPLSGKTRTAWAVLRRNVRSDVRMYVAQAGTELRDLPAQLRGRDPEGGCLVWLDDLAGHLGEHGLTAGLLAQLTQEKVLVVATMNDDDYDTHRFGGGPNSRALSGAGTVQLSCRWSVAELARLAAFEDPRLVDAREWRGGSGITQFLALGPELWDEWRRARRRHPLGHLVVRAAVDLARCGITSDVPEVLLRETCAGYGEVDLAGEDFEAALAWAAATRHGVTGLLVRGGQPGTWRAYGSLVADAVRSPEAEPVPDQVWGTAVAGARTHRLDVETAVAAFRAVMVPRADDGDLIAMNGLAALAHWDGDVSEAESWYRKAAALGDPRAGHGLGQILADRGAKAEAIHYLEIAAEAGMEDAYVTLGKLHRDRARHWLTKGAEAGDMDAVTYLKSLRAGTDVLEEETGQTE